MFCLFRSTVNQFSINFQSICVWISSLSLHGIVKWENLFKYPKILSKFEELLITIRLRMVMNRFTDLLGTNYTLYLVSNNLRANSSRIFIGHRSRTFWGIAMTSIIFVMSVSLSVMEQYYSTGWVFWRSPGSWWWLRVSDCSWL